MKGSLSFLLLVLLAIPIVSAQSCLNYGTGSPCSCPAGFGGADCSILLCASGLDSPGVRSAFSPAAAGDPSLGCDRQCNVGWTGPTCGVPLSDQACTAATTRAGSDAAILSSGAYVWSEGFVTCDVVNPTLEGSFPGTTTLDFQHVANSDFSLYPETAGNNSMRAALFYSPATGNSTLTEQFFCKADTCTQTNTTSTSGVTVTWACTNLECTCIPNTIFCGGGGAIDLTETINGLDGGISVACDASGASCAFKQTVLQTLFGAGGLTLSGCQHGECVQPSSIATLSSRFSDAVAGGGGSGLSGGVIAGLAVLGAILAVLLALLVLGCAGQRKASRRPLGAGSSISEKGVGAVGVRWEALGYSLPSRPRTWILPGGRRQQSGRVIIDGFSGHVDGGQFCAILGPTGAGKSTFVDLLAGKSKSGEKTGSVHFALPPEWQEDRVTIGFVDQHDILPATSTVKEALQFAADLKMKENVSQATKEARVFQILGQLGLMDVADSQIGSTERRGISGGERRRLSIGLELLGQPSVLICDEPTSGLDSSSAMRVVQVLKDLTTSSSGRRTTVITTIHQPSSQVFYLFDHVILIGGGRLLYNAPARDVGSWAASQGSPVPSGWNPADHLLELASSPLSSGQSHSDIEDSKESSDALSKGSPSTRVYSRPSTTLLTQFEVLARRELRHLRRDWSGIVMHTTVSVLVGLFVGGMYYKVNETIGGFQSRIGALFFLGALLAFASLSALSNFANVKSLFLRERANSYYSPFAWLASRVVLDIIPLRIVPTIIVSCIVYWMVGLHHDAAAFFKFLLILILFNITTTLWNLFLAASIAEPGVAILVSSVVNLFQMAFAGFFVNLGSIPAVLRWLQWLAPLKYTLEALAVNEVNSGLMIKDSLEGVPVEVSASLIMGILFGFESTAYYRNVLIIMAFLITFALALVGTVVWRLREKR